MGRFSVIIKKTEYSHNIRKNIEFLRFIKMYRIVIFTEYYWESTRDFFIVLFGLTYFIGDI